MNSFVSNGSPPTDGCEPLSTASSPSPRPGMFRTLAVWANRYHWLVLLVWVLSALTLWWVAPKWDDVAHDGDFDYLPIESTSRQAQILLEDAFPEERSKSTIVLVFAREEAALTKADGQFAFEVSQKLAELVNALPEELQASINVAEAKLARLQESASQIEDASQEPAQQELAAIQQKIKAQEEKLAELNDQAQSEKLGVGEVWTENTPAIGNMMVSPPPPEQVDSPNPKLPVGQATMVVARLNTDMMAIRNVEVMKQVTELVKEARADKNRPQGLSIGMSGSAMIGGDMQDSIRESLASTEITTVILVVACLVMIYRSPLLVLIPLATIGISLLTAYSVVSLCAQHLGPDTFDWGGFKVFTTTKIFVVVILFGAGTDFCLFLIARYKEELGNGAQLKNASGQALMNVGDALAASAFTTILGLATMAFADYGKFVYSGPIVAMSLFIALVACVTFAPALLRMLGSVVFWPLGVEKMTGSDKQEQSESKLWAWVADCVMARPGTILMASAWLAAPFIFWGFTWIEVSHDLMGELAPTRASVQGTELIRKYYAPGEVAPTLIVAQTEDLDLTADGNEYAIAFLHTLLAGNKKEGIPGIEGVIDARDWYLPAGKYTGSTAAAALIRNNPEAIDKFISDSGEYAGKVTQLQIILDADPFSREARSIVDRIEERLEAVTSGEIANDASVDKNVRQGLAVWKGTRFEFGGATPGVRDLEAVTISDQTRIQVCVVIAVFAVIWVILKNFKVCVYLIITVLLSYFATIGITDIFFTWLYAETYDGLDWKVPIFLFVILIAVGQDYNIYLTTRVFEEQAKLGMRQGLRRAVIQTGGIITSCGIIMAGTFVSMTTGTLRAMIELGFSLSLGVLLDTFFVRTVVVPCFFALTARAEEPSMEVPAHDVQEPTQSDVAVEQPEKRTA